MGYVGQHLVSVVTGYEGGRSGARGDDLKLPGGKVAEIKCCYRVDQLGKCEVCGAGVASIETECPSLKCGSTKILRGADSKWLLAPKDEKELRELFAPALYYLVLFEFVDVVKATDIDVRIFEVDPQCLGFRLCMIDYFFNIRAKSKSSAPFNLWPDSPKLQMMKPRVIYHSVIRSTDTVDTIIFPGKNQPKLLALADLAQYASKGTIDEGAIDALAKIRHVSLSGPFPSNAAARKKQKLTLLQSKRVAQKWNDLALADDLARAVFAERLAPLKAWLKDFAPGA